MAVRSLLLLIMLAGASQARAEDSPSPLGATFGLESQLWTTTVLPSGMTDTQEHTLVPAPGAGVGGALVFGWRGVGNVPWLQLHLRLGLLQPPGLADTKTNVYTYGLQPMLDAGFGGQVWALQPHPAIQLSVVPGINLGLTTPYFWPTWSDSPLIVHGGAEVAFEADFFCHLALRLRVGLENIPVHPFFSPNTYRMFSIVSGLSVSYLNQKCP